MADPPDILVDLARSPPDPGVEKEDERDGQTAEQGHQRTHPQREHQGNGHRNQAEQVIDHLILDEAAEAVDIVYQPHFPVARLLFLKSSQGQPLVGIPDIRAERQGETVKQAVAHPQLHGSQQQAAEIHRQQPHDHLVKHRDLALPHHVVDKDLKEHRIDQGNRDRRRAAQEHDDNQPPGFPGIGLNSAENLPTAKSHAAPSFPNRRR